MRLYHGSNLIITSPDIRKSKRFLDFGMGFYLTSNQEQAISFAHKVVLRAAKSNQQLVGIATVSAFDFDLSAAKKVLCVQQFLEPNEEWLDFVVSNRIGKTNENYDVVIGPVANDDVFLVVGKYEDGLITKEEALKQFKIKKLFDQYTLCSEAAIGMLKFVSFEQFQEGGHG